MELTVTAQFTYRGRPVLSNFRGRSLAVMQLISDMLYKLSSIFIVCIVIQRYQKHRMVSSLLLVSGQSQSLTLLHCV